MTHTQCYDAAHGTTNDGPLYQGRFKSHPVVDPSEADSRHFHQVAAYIEGNAARSYSVDRAEDWRWSSLALRARYGPTPPTLRGLLTPPPVPWPPDWPDLVNAAAQRRDDA